MPVSLPLAPILDESQRALRDWGAGLLLLWTVAMLLFGAIASFGHNTAFYETIDLIPIF